MTRGSVAYDSIDDELHVIWEAQASSDGMIYRRYTITRDGRINITAITYDSSVNLQLDYSSSNTLGQTVAIWNNDGSAHGLLIAVWAKYGTGFAEVRGSMRQLSMTSADGTAGNWTAISSAGVFSTDPPQVTADKIFTATSGDVEEAAGIRGGSGIHAKDIYVFAGENNSTNNRVDVYRATWNSGSLNWSGGWTSVGVLGQINTTGGGYILKNQLLTRPVLDTANDRLYLG